MPLEFIDFARVFNFRDLGGLPAGDGRALRHGVLFRADNLGSLKDDDRERFCALGVRTIIDLRQPAEIERLGGRAPAWSCQVWHNIAITNPVWREEDYSEEQGPVTYLVARYHEAAEVAGPDMARTIALLADPELVPVAVHCLGGRDRTGMIMAFVEGLLGVRDEVIAADYHFTEQATQRFMTWYRTVKPGAEELRPYINVTPEAVILTFLKELREKHGSVEEYLKSHGLTSTHIDSLRDLYLA